MKETASEAQQLFDRGVEFAGKNTIPDLVAAIEALEMARSLWSKTGDRDREVLTLLELGSLYKALGATTPARERYNEALTFYQERGDRLLEAFILAQIGSLYAEDAIQLKLDSLPYQVGFPEENESSLTLSGLGSTSEIEGNSPDEWDSKIEQEVERAREFYARSLEIYEELNNSSNPDRIAVRQAQAQTLKRMGMMFVQRRRFYPHFFMRYYHFYDNFYNFKPKNFLEQSLEIYQEIGDLQGEAFVLGQLMKLYRDDPVKSEQLFDRAITIYDDLESARGDRNTTILQAKAKLLNIAAQNTSRETRETALMFYDRALTLYQQIGDRHGEANTIFDLAQFYSEVDVLKSRTYYQKSLNLYAETGDLFSQAEVYKRLGGTYFNLKDWIKSLSFFEQELDTIDEIIRLYQKLNDEKLTLKFKYRKPIILLKIAFVSNQEGDREQEFQALSRAQTVYQQPKNIKRESNFLISIAQYHQWHNRPKQSQKAIDEAIALYRESGDLEGEVRFLRDRVQRFFGRNLIDDIEPVNSRKELLLTYDRIIAIYQQLGNKREEARSLANLAEFYFSSLTVVDNIELKHPENTELALSFYQKALNVSREISDPDVQKSDQSFQVYLLLAMAKIYYVLDRQEQCVETLKEIERTTSGLDDLYNLAVDATTYEEPLLAIDFYYKLLQASRDLKMNSDSEIRYEESLIFRSISEIYYYELNDLGRALRYFEKAYQLDGKNQNLEH
ncbi:tetratricopeptide repeat protein [Oxynema aestuarii]|uniref:Tetratricopeptide repeat protein n=1 Tax=Oxynema aestuarii AP17 TaxID=2064643 RepID=A0A6H1U3X2_9CYAN|nr:tetratricopeptide repeat protein [Oxynema aestuarii]QIZ72850.1 tetratricopeptide repeat protein [Oxynema aestuarii AP17]